MIKILNLESLTSVGRHGLATYPYFYYVYSTKPLDFDKDFGTLLPEFAHIQSTALTSVGHYTLKYASEFLDEAYSIGRKLVEMRSHVPLSVAISKFASEIKELNKLMRLFCSYTKSASYCEEPIEAIQVRNLLEKSAPDELKSFDRTIEELFQKDAELLQIYNALNTTRLRIQRTQRLRKQFLDEISTFGIRGAHMMRSRFEQFEDSWWVSSLATFAMNPRGLTDNEGVNELFTNIQTGVKPRIRRLVEKLVAIANNIDSLDDLRRTLAESLGETPSTLRQTVGESIKQMELVTNSPPTFSTIFLHYAYDDLFSNQRSMMSNETAPTSLSTDPTEGDILPWAIFCMKGDGRISFQARKKPDSTLALYGLCLAEFAYGLVLGRKPVCPLQQIDGIKFSGTAVEEPHLHCPSFHISAR